MKQRRREGTIVPVPCGHLGVVGREMGTHHQNARRADGEGHRDGALVAVDAGEACGEGSDRNEGNEGETRRRLAAGSRRRPKKEAGEESEKKEKKRDEMR